MLTRRRFLNTAAALPLLSTNAAPQQAGKPNVLMIVVDDLDCRVGCYGDPVAITPNIDRIARRGVRFHHAYCQYPLCNPTRSSVFSGRYPTSTGVLDNNTLLVLEEGQYTMPEYFERNGYSVAQFGKIFHGPNKGMRRGGARPDAPRGPLSPGWSTPEERAQQQKSDPAFWDKVHTPYRNIRPPDPSAYAWANVYGPLPEGERGVDMPIADGAIASLEKMVAGTNPFFLAVGFLRPHVPLTAPKKYFDMFDPARIPLPPDFDTEPRLIPGVPRDEFRRNLDLFADRTFTVNEAREALRAYYACSTYMDEQVGRVLDKLRAVGKEDNTIVMLWGDHGWHLSEKGMWAKGTLFEVSARGPMIISQPGASQDSVCRRTVQYLDMYPTLVDLCGLPRAGWLEGTSISSLLANPGATWNRPAYTVQARNWFIGRSVRTERWRYTEWDEGRRGSALYDHDSDPHEMRNLAADTKHASTVSELQKFLRDGPVARDPGKA